MPGIVIIPAHSSLKHFHDARLRRRERKREGEKARENDSHFELLEDTEKHF